jgi:hypothetical protein
MLFAFPIISLDFGILLVWRHCASLSEPFISKQNLLLMNNLGMVKRYLGKIWILLGPALFVCPLVAAIHFITAATEGDVGNSVPWIIILVIICPIALGLTIFGWYCWKGEYDEAKV